MAIPVIYKGDDTDFRGSTGFTLKVVTSSNLNLSGCTVEVEVLGFRRSFPASATGELVCPFAFTAAETQRMPLGIHAATVRVFDAKGRVRTINNSIRVKVTNSVHEAYGKDDPQEVTLAVSTVDLEAYAKKAEVTAAITAALKDAGASVKLHALTPEVADTTVTLAPVTGAANWVAEKVEVQGSKTFSGNFTLTTAFWVDLSNIPDSGYYSVTDSVLIDQDCAELLIGGKDLEIGDGYNFIEFTLTKDIQLTIHDEMFATLKAGCRLEYQSEHNRDAEDMEELYLSGITSVASESVVLLGKFADATLEYLIGEYESHLARDVNIVYPKSLTAAIPKSAADTKARQFTLAVETDAESEKSVEWQGGEVIESVPGASKLGPGLTVWDVAEVAPGKFKVERASSPAQSTPLTLTAPNGRVAELTVGDDLVLEVKEI